MYLFVFQFGRVDPVQREFIEESLEVDVQLLSLDYFCDGLVVVSVVAYEFLELFELKAGLFLLFAYIIGKIIQKSANNILDDVFFITSATCLTAIFCFVFEKYQFFVGEIIFLLF